MIKNLRFPDHGTFLKTWPIAKDTNIEHIGLMLHYVDVEEFAHRKEGNVVHLSGALVAKKRLYLAFRMRGVGPYRAFTMRPPVDDASEWDALDAVDKYHADHKDEYMLDCEYLGEQAHYYVNNDGALVLRVVDIFKWPTNEYEMPERFDLRNSPVELRWYEEEEFITSVLRSSEDGPWCVDPRVLTTMCRHHPVCG